MSHMNRLILTLTLLLSMASLSAQNADSSNHNVIGMIGRYNGKALVIRWAPGNNASFNLLKQYGYKLEKAQVAKDSHYFKAVWKTIGIFKPADSLTWAKRVDTSNDYQVVAAYCALASFKNRLPAKPNYGELMKRSQEENNLHGFAMVAADFDTTAANLLGLRYEDHDFLQDAVYAYRVTSMVPESVLKIAGSSTFVRTVRENDVAPPQMLDIGFEHHVRLDWYNQLHKQYFTGYYLERGDAKGRNFKRLNKNPLILANDPNNPREKDHMTYVDSFPKDYVVYSYRLVGLNPFGELSEPGPVVYSYGRDMTAPANAHDLDFADMNGKAISLSWKKDQFEPDFTGFNVLRAQHPQGPFLSINPKLLDKSTTRFLDTKPDEMEGAYYKIEVVDTAGNRNWSLGVYAFLRDSIPPSKPTGLKGVSDSNGVITLTWNLGPEQDIKGYRVFYANQADHEFTNLTGDLWQDTVFRDTVNIKTLTEEIYYQVVAADRHYNHSLRSDILKVKLPDTIAPVKPLFKNILITDTAVYLSYIPSSSKDVVKHILYRKKGEGQFAVWKTIYGHGETNIRDTSVKIGEVYTYKIEALDDAGNSSGFPAEVSGKIYDVGKRTPISAFSAVYNTEKKRVVLKWNYPPSDRYHFVVYRSYNGSTFRVYHSVDGTKNTWEDYDLPGKGTYTYAVVAYYLDGGSSGLSKQVVLEVK